MCRKKVSCATRASHAPAQAKAWLRRLRNTSLLVFFFLVLQHDGVSNPHVDATLASNPGSPSGWTKPDSLGSDRTRHYRVKLTRLTELVDSVCTVWPDSFKPVQSIDSRSGRLHGLAFSHVISTGGSLIGFDFSSRPQNLRCQWKPEQKSWLTKSTPWKNLQWVDPSWFARNRWRPILIV